MLSAPLLFVTSVPSRPDHPCWLHSLQPDRERKRAQEKTKQNLRLLVKGHSHLSKCVKVWVYVGSTYTEGLYTVFVSLGLCVYLCGPDCVCVWVSFCIGLACVFVSVSFFCMPVCVCVCILVSPLGHLCPDNEAVAPLSSLYSSLDNCSRFRPLSPGDQGNEITNIITQCQFL